MEERRAACVDREQRRPGEAQAINCTKLPVEPQMEIDHRNALELLQLQRGEEGEVVEKREGRRGSNRGGGGRDVI